VLDLTLSNVSAVSIQLRAAGLDGPRSSLHVTTDGPSRVRLVGLPAHAVVRVAGGAAQPSDPRGTALVALSAGSSVITIEPPTAPAQGAESALPATGTNFGAPALSTMLLLAGLLLARGQIRRFLAREL
jgi:hypothetical protein